MSDKYPVSINKRCSGNQAKLHVYYVGKMTLVLHKVGVEGKDP